MIDRVIVKELNFPGQRYGLDITLALTPWAGSLVIVSPSSETASLGSI